MMGPKFGFNAAVIGTVVLCVSVGTIGWSVAGASLGTAMLELTELGVLATVPVGLDTDRIVPCGWYGAAGSPAE